MRLFRFTLLLFAAALTLACAGDSPLAPGERRALDRAKALWESRRPAEYTYEGRVSCFCDPSLSIWTEVRVRGDSVIAATPLQLVPGSGTPAGPSAWRTVPGLFRAIESAASSDYTRDVVTVYDDELGYPRSIDVRCHENIADCGVTYEARNLRAVR